MGTGVRVDLGKDWGVRADARAIVGPGQDKQPVVGVEAALAVYGRFPWKSPPPQSPDKDGDGVTDAQDKCPEAAGAVTLEGCPGEEKSDDDVDADEAEAKKASGDTPATSAPAPVPTTEKKP